MQFLCAHETLPEAQHSCKCGAIVCTSQRVALLSLFSVQQGFEAKSKGKVFIMSNGLSFILHTSNKTFWSNIQDERACQACNCQKSAISLLSGGFYSRFGWCCLWPCWSLSFFTKATIIESPRDPAQFITKARHRNELYLWVMQLQVYAWKLVITHHSHTSFNLSCLLHVSGVISANLDLESKICSRGCRGLQRLFCNWQESKYSKNACAVKAVNLEWPGASDTAVLMVSECLAKQSLCLQQVNSAQSWRSGPSGKHFCKWEQTISKASLCLQTL